MIPRVQKLGDCLPGCPNKRQPHECCCPRHWARVPRELKVELWAAQKQASHGRGRKNNGRSTERWKQAFRAIIGWLMLEAKKDPGFVCLSETASLP